MILALILKKLQSEYYLISMIVFVIIHFVKEFFLDYLRCRSDFLTNHQIVRVILIIIYFS